MLRRGRLLMIASDSQPLRVVVADDQALVRTGFAMILGADGIDVVAEAGNGAQAVDAVRRTRPDVVLMDIRMPEMDGLEATRRIVTGSPTGAPRVIILTTYDLDSTSTPRSGPARVDSCSKTSRPSTWSPRSGWCGLVTLC